MSLMMEAAVAFERICNDIENMSEPNLVAEVWNTLKEEVDSKREELSIRVDRRILYIDSLKAKIAQAEKNVHMWQQRNQRLITILDSVKSFTLAEVNSTKEELKGRNGRFKAVKNSVGSLIVDEDSEDLKAHYQRSKTVITLDKAAIREDLVSGKKIKGAEIIFGEHLRILL